MVGNIFVPSSAVATLGTPDFVSWVELSASKRSAFEAKPSIHPNIENVLNLTCVGLHAPLPWCSMKGKQNFLFVSDILLINMYQQIKLFVYWFDFSTTKRPKFNVIHVLFIEWLYSIGFNTLHTQKRIILCRLCLFYKFQPLQGHHKG
jgi:hypothetical protein